MGYLKYYDTASNAARAHPAHKGLFGKSSAKNMGKAIHVIGWNARIHN